MAVTMPRETWTDERLDDLNKKVDDGFQRVEKQIDNGLAGVKGEVREVRREMNAGFEQLNTRFDSMGRGLFAAAGAIIVAMIGCVSTLVGIAVL